MPEGGVGGVWTGLPLHAGAEINDIRLDFLEVLIAHPPSCQGSGGMVFHHNVRFCYQFVSQFHPHRPAEVESDAFLVNSPAPASGSLGPGGGAEPNDLCSAISQHLRGQRTCEPNRHIDNSYSFKQLSRHPFLLSLNSINSISSINSK